MHNFLYQLNFWNKYKNQIFYIETNNKTFNFNKKMEIEEKKPKSHEDPPIQKPRKPRISEYWRIIGLIEAGGDQSNASIHFQVVQSSISRIWKKFQELGNVKSKKHTGRPQEIDEKIKEETVKGLLEPRVSLHEVAIKTKISKTTAWRIAQEYELDFRKYGEVPSITEKASYLRVDFANAWLGKNQSNFIFTDESYFHIFRNTLGTWCKKGTHPIIKKLNPNKALMVWAAISSKGKSHLWIGKYGFKINSEEYCKMLNNTLIPMIKTQFPDDNYLVLQDNARCHTSKETIKWLTEKNIKMLPNYPPYSPDFNAIEKIWKIMKDFIEKNQPKNLSELHDMIYKSYETITQEMINSWIHHVQVAFSNCIDKKGY